MPSNTGSPGLVPECIHTHLFRSLDCFSWTHEPPDSKGEASWAPFSVFGLETPWAPLSLDEDLTSEGRQNYEQALVQEENASLDMRKEQEAESEGT